jgi:hypothetical protein
LVRTARKARRERLLKVHRVRCDILIGINGVCDISQAQYPCVIFKCHKEELWRFLVKTRNLGYIDMCDISPVDIYGCDTLPAINRQV